ncbi:MAG: MBL fold metallo-hydrolase [candidate division KSB1 bacterium]|nr:MBL fold metallo-hydrolase [candidate division KSB1 bacterium]MDZ7341215.1 MBL fold metallo-hydrolase [candidate division KSB1 bacterium]
MIHSLHLGNCQLFFLHDGAFSVDCGALFGIVPKMIWEKVVQPDDMNRYEITINPLLVKTPEHHVLIDPGLGNKYSDKMRFIYNIKNDHSVERSLSEIGLKPEDIDIVIATHAHFDHIGAGTKIDADGKIVPTFPKAKYYFQKGEWDEANHPDERTKATYFKENLQPLEEHGLVELIDGDAQILPQIRVEKTGGHTKHHQMVIIESDGQTAVYPGDILPSSFHLPITYVMALDLYPVEVMEAKRKLYQRAIEGDWLVIIDHGEQVRAGHVRFDGKRYSFEAVLDN